jgi:lipoprotein-releasing system permease protein
MKYENLIGLRYTRARRTSQFVVFLSIVSMAGVALAVAALIVVLSVVNGFEHEFRRGILGATPHVQATGYDGTITDWKAIAAHANLLTGVKAVAPYVSGQGLISMGAKVQGAVLRGIDPALESRASDLARQIQDGKLEDLKPGSMGLVLGSELARNLGVKVGDRVALVIPDANSTSEQAMPRMKPARVVATFSVGMYDFDNGLALVHIDDMRSIFRLGDRVSGVRIQLEDPMLAPLVAEELAQRQLDLFITDWTRGNANLFHAVRTSKRMVVLVVSLLIVVAAFNIVTSLVMAVTDKRSDIAILRTLGATPGAIMRIFAVQGVTIGVVGTVIGTVLGVLIALQVPTLVQWAERTFGFKAIDAEIYRIAELPSQLQWGDVLVTAGVALVLSALATLYPSLRAARVKPAAALRHD